jgi:hypothetical protein
MSSFTYERAVLPLFEGGALRSHASRPAHVEALAFVHWQYGANEKAYANKLITQSMYELARDELRKSIDCLSKLCCCAVKGG